MSQSVSALGSVVHATRKSKNLYQGALSEKLGTCERMIMDIKNIGNIVWTVVYVNEEFG